MSESSLRIETKLVHAGEPLPRILGAVEMPIFQSATFEYGGEGSYHDVRYLRTNNTPSQLALQAKIAALENAPASLVTASGMAAISTTLLTVLSAGDRLLAQSCLYGGTHDLMNRDFATLGLAVDFIDADRRESWQAQLRPTTRAIYVEAMTNPLLQVADLEAVVEFARAHGLISIIDNTFASPVNFRPIEAGFDLSIHSATKYLNGHADIVAGVVSGGAELIERIRHKANHLGGSLDPHAAFLLSRGLKTLALRVRYQNESTLRIARFLEGHRAIECVHYAGLESHPRHARARSLFAGFGGVLSFELKGPASRADEFAARVRLPIVAPSLGGVHTLLTRPATTSHAGLAPEERARLGIGDGLLRLSVGIESTEDLLEDLERALR
ncbi:MAG: aminotransferase class I/II-fold pyridoxal phosphate-dependent enzyme [Gammaproteobacteria bacterium]|nr:MAG: aminotransferase class I/II-fold pyridoxal phosphate-dependent enzyme [Gammaproteobacteria bacterium]